MDPSLYKDFKTSRGYNYHYVASVATAGKPTLLFLHGFPTTSYSWHEQIKFFKGLGYGVIAPDLLGYGGTDKPTDGAQYRMKLMAQDIMDIIVHEDVKKAILVAHDWGSVLLSRIANYYQHDSRIIGFAFFALSYYHPVPDWHTEGFIEHTSNFHDEEHEMHGYFIFFGKEGAAKILEDHSESFFSLLYTEDPKILQKNLCPVGALKKWLLSDMTTKTATWLTDEEKKHHVDPILAGGFAAPLGWYKQMMDKHTPEDDATIAKEDYLIHKPVLFVAGLKDVVLPPAMSEASHKEYCPEGSIVEIDADHFLINSAPDECNKALLSWIENLNLGN